jgi:hypothetical protein
MFSSLFVLSITAMYLLHVTVAFKNPALIRGVLIKRSFASDSLSQKRTFKTEPLFRLQTTKLSAGSVLPCVESASALVVQVVFVFLGILGIHTYAQAKAAKLIVAEVGESTIKAISADFVKSFAAEASTVSKAGSVFKMMGQIYNVLGVSGFLKALTASLEWYDIAILGVTVPAQLVAIFASDGVAFIAELALNAAALAQLAECVAHVVRDCGNV